MGELCSTTVEIVPVAQHGGGTLGGGLICASLRSCRALVLWTNTSQNHVLLTTAWFVITTIPFFFLFFFRRSVAPYGFILDPYQSCLVARSIKVSFFLILLALRGLWRLKWVFVKVIFVGKVPGLKIKSSKRQNDSTGQVWHGYTHI